MKLFHWPRVEALKNYMSGDIIVMAPDLEAARKLAWEWSVTWLKEHRSWWFNFDGTPDPDFSEDRTEWEEKLEQDLRLEPDEIDHPVFIRGSE